MCKRLFKYKSHLKKIIKKLFNLVGAEISGIKPEFPSDVSEDEACILRRSQPYTMTSTDRMIAILRSIEYIEKYKINGSVVECGVWQGGSMMTAAYALLQHGCVERELYLYDTFEGMSESGKEDFNSNGIHAKTLLMNDRDIYSIESLWCKAPLDQVKSNIESTGYPLSKIHYVVGKVEHTIPKILPSKIALLRLDTDWYESTKHELKFLFPLVVQNGIIIIDDYGDWRGAKKATDEFIALQSKPVHLMHIDHTGRLFVKN